jgi:quercetin dioxygenase-like cupin family protein
MMQVEFETFGVETTMALLHAKPGQPIDITPLGAALHGSETHAILKTRSLELMRIVLRAGEGLPSHHVRGESTLLCIEGVAEVKVEGSAYQLRPNELVLLPAQTQHAVLAIEDVSMLLTIQLPPGTPGSASSTD